jgi:hypothetical protein
MDQVLHSTVVADYVRTVEAKVGHSRTVLVGDFNMNPFERGVVGPPACTPWVRVMLLLARVAQSPIVIYPFFYNPMWSLFGDRSGRATRNVLLRWSEQVEFFWHMFDQVLVRPALLPGFQT